MQKEEILLGEIRTIGAADKAVIGLYDVESREFIRTELNRKMEITSLLRNITEKDGKPYLHLHINLCDEKMNMHGGHLVECRISATCEIIIQVFDGKVSRQHDAEGTGLNLFAF